MIYTLGDNMILLPKEASDSPLNIDMTMLKVKSKEILNGQYDEEWGQANRVPYKEIMTFFKGKSSDEGSSLKKREMFIYLLKCHGISSAENERRISEFLKWASFILFTMKMVQGISLNEEENELQFDNGYINDFKIGSVQKKIGRPIMIPGEGVRRLMGVQNTMGYTTVTVNRPGEWSGTETYRKSDISESLDMRVRKYTLTWFVPIDFEQTERREISNSGGVNGYVKEIIKRADIYGFNYPPPEEIMNGGGWDNTAATTEIKAIHEQSWKDWADEMQNENGIERVQTHIEYNNLSIILIMKRQEFHDEEWESRIESLIASGLSKYGIEYTKTTWMESRNKNNTVSRRLEISTAEDSMDATIYIVDEIAHSFIRNIKRNDVDISTEEVRPGVIQVAVEYRKAPEIPRPSDSTERKVMERMDRSKTALERIHYVSDIKISPSTYFYSEKLNTHNYYTRMDWKNNPGYEFDKRELKVKPNAGEENE